MNINIYISKNIIFVIKNLFNYIYFLNIRKDELIFLIDFKNLYNSLFYFNKNSIMRYSLLMDILAIDKPYSRNRFTIIYRLVSITYNLNLLLKINFLPYNSIATVLPLYKSSGWLEREVWDFFGIYFYNHPDLRRILTDYGFSGHPLLKDFPLSGYFEIFYNNEKKRIILELLDISQEYRFFKFKSPWE